MTMSLLLIGSLLTFTSFQDDKSQDAGKKELEKIQGTWVATTYEVGGQNPPADILKTIKIVCTGDKYVQFMQGMEVEKGTHKLDPTKSPKHMDVTITEGDGKGQVQLCIYEVDGDTMKICANGPGSKERPKEFSAKGGAINIVMKREKKEEKKEEKKSDK